MLFILALSRLDHGVRPTHPGRYQDEVSLTLIFAKKFIDKILQKLESFDINPYQSSALSSATYLTAAPWRKACSKTLRAVLVHDDDVITRYMMLRVTWHERKVQFTVV
jgi:hypothetical protein